MTASSTPEVSLVPPGAGRLWALLADRFLVLPGFRTIDLSTGREVVCHVWSDGAARGRHRAERCARLIAWRHRNFVPLVDFGLLPDGAWFEAYGHRARVMPWRARGPGTRRALRHVVDGLHRRGLSAGRLAWSRVVTVDGQPALLPDGATGFLFEELAGASSGPRSKEATWVSRLATGATGDDDGVRPGVWREVRLPLDGLVDVLEAGRSGSLRTLEMVAPGAVLPGGVELVARVARLHGYVPLALGAERIVPDLVPHLANRHLVLLAAGGRPCLRSGSIDESGFVETALELSVRSARPRTLLVVREDAGSGHGWIGARDPFRPDRVTAWVPRTCGAGTGAVASARVLHVAEASQAYGGPEGRPELAAPGFPGERPRRTNGPESDPREEAIVARARALAGRGRHAAAERLLRRAYGAGERRGWEAAAARLAEQIGWHARWRGRLEAAAGWFERARLGYSAAGNPARAVGAAIGLAILRVDAGRLDEAEGLLRAARAAALHLERREEAARATGALTRCLFWQDRLAEADECLARWAEIAGTRETGMLCLESRVARCLGDVERGGRAADEALAAAEQSGIALAAIAARAAAAELQGTAGSLEGLERHVRAGMELAAALHAGLWGLRLRGIRLEGLVRAGRGAEARAQGGRLARVAGRLAHGLLRTRLERAAEAATRPPRLEGRVRETAIPLATAYGRRPEHPAQTRWQAIGQALVQLLTLCQDAEDETRALEAACRRVRETVGASGVALFDDSASGSPLAQAGLSFGSCPPAAAQVQERGEGALALRVPEGLQFAAAIRAGGRLLGTLAVRWAVDASPAQTWLEAYLPAAAATLAPCIHTLLERRRTERETLEAGLDIIGLSEAIGRVRLAVARVAGASFPVLVLGESGTGKELVARAVHRLSARARGPFCAVNCAAVADELFEAELFGHGRGAFTGAVAERAGLFEAADGGTLLLDEVGELSARAQAKLLRVIQEGEVRRVGENRPRRVDVRIVAATNRSLDAAATAGAFRRDLLYRLDVLRIVVPPLRERPEDVPLLVRHFWARLSAQAGSRAVLDEAVIAALGRYEWPGNVRELQNVMAGLAVRAAPRGRVRLSALPAAFGIPADGGAGEASLEDARRSFDRRYVAAALARAGGHRGRAASALGVTRQGLAKLVRRLGLEPSGRSREDGSNEGGLRTHGPGAV